MVLGIITAIAACPAIVGTTEAVRQGQRQNAKEKHRGVKSNLYANCSRLSKFGREVDGSQVVLSEGKLYLAMPSPEFPEGHPEDHPFAGYFLPFPDQNWGRLGEGFVSTISDEPPQLNWIYIDRDTYELKYGDRVTAEPHLVGPWDVTKVDKRITFEGWEGFMAVRYGPKEWAFYFDRDDDGLKYICPEEMFRVEILLTRRERKQTKPGPPDDDSGIT